jgi:hypothetical protein
VSLSQHENMNSRSSPRVSYASALRWVSNSTASGDALIRWDRFGALRINSYGSGFADRREAKLDVLPIEHRRCLCP